MTTRQVTIQRAKAAPGRTLVGDFVVPPEALQVVVTFDLPQDEGSQLLGAPFWYGWEWPGSEIDAIEGCGVDGSPVWDDDARSFVRRTGVAIPADAMPRDPRVLRLWIDAAAPCEYQGAVTYVLDEARPWQDLARSVRFGAAPVEEKSAAQTAEEATRRQDAADRRDQIKGGRAEAGATE